MSKKRNLIFICLLILGVFLITSCLPKPPVTEGILKGQVIVPEGTLQEKDLTGQALPDATVNIIDPATGDIIATTVTDANGYYQVFVPAGGPYLLQVVKDGVVILQITPQVEVGIEYDLGTADCNTTAVALIALAMMDAGANLADINLDDIAADPNFDDVLSNVTSIIEAGGDPTESAVIQQAVEDFLSPPAPPPPTTPTYTVTYDGNGSTGGTVPTDANNYEQGDSVTVLGNTGNLVKTQDGISLLFTGWNTAANGSETSYNEADTFNMGNANVTLFAQWSVLGGTGPAGGLIFYDKGDVSDGWRYLEAAPSDQSAGPSQAWSNIIDVEIGISAQGIAIGTGQTNTTAIIEQTGHTESAAKLCNELTIGSYNDWFLPSEDELNLMYTNLYSEGVGGFYNDSYWSSSEVNAAVARFQYFWPGSTPGNYLKSNSAVRVRAARAFRSTAPTYMVNYNGNGFTDGTVPSDSYHYEQGETVTVLGNTGTLVKTGYTFAGWNTQADGNGTARAEGSTFTMGNDNVTLYAKWAAVIDIAAIPGVTVPVTGATPVTGITETAQYTGTVTWSPDHGTFAGTTVYTATITLTPKAGYTLTGVTENFFTVVGATTVTNAADSGVVTAVFPETAAAVIDIAAIPGVTVPVTGATPVTTITETAQYTGTVTWNPVDNPFLGGTAYTATITLTAKAGFTLTSVAANFFTVAGTSSPATNAADSGVVTAVFPETTYSLRDEGPAGGLIFYINPNYATDGWRYLEAAPASTEWVGIQWGSDWELIDGTGTAIGTGMDNTGIIVDWLDNHLQTGKAAQLCYNLSIENNSKTYNDWFLPSKDELNQMRIYLYGWGVGGFSAGNLDYYWSSSENNAGTAWQQKFLDGGQGVFSKFAEIRVRAVRSF